GSAGRVLAVEAGSRLRDPGAVAGGPGRRCARGRRSRRRFNHRDPRDRAVGAGGTGQRGNAERPGRDRRSVVSATPASPASTSMNAGNGAAAAPQHVAPTASMNGHESLVEIKDLVKYYPIEG